MSLVTRCPSCNTLFKVVPDQLRISNGWVRCGQCSEIFDAALHVQEGDALLAVSPVPDPSAGAPADALAGLVIVRQRIDDSPQIYLDVQEALTPAPEPAQAVEAGPKADGSGTPAVVAGTPEAPRSEPPSVEPSFDLTAEIDEPLITPSFVRETAPEGRNPTRAWWGWLAGGLLVIGLLSALALQAGRVERDQLAQRWPALRPTLTLLCNVTGCAVRPLRDPDAWVIESSSLTRVVDDVYRLNLQLRNRSDHSLMWPDLEVTLTDAHDQPVLRRILKPMDWSGMDEDATLEAGRLWQGHTTLRVRMPAGTSRFVGYRLYAFYL